MNNTIANIRLHNQQLLSTQFSTPKEIVAWMGAMQAQDYNMAKLAIQIRTTNTTDQLIEEAFNRGDILRTHVLRPTWHFVTPENIRWMLELTAPRIKSAMKGRILEFELTPQKLSKCYDVMAKSLGNNTHLIRTELAEELVKSKTLIDPAAIVYCIMCAEVDGIICSGAMRGKKHTYALLDERAPKTAPLAHDEALARLAQTYFTSHSPATLQDFFWWSGLGVRDARIGMELIKADFVEEKVGDQIYLFPPNWQEIDVNLESEFLIPAFDEYTISYRDRSATIPSDHHRRVISINGIFKPTIIRNGRLAGIWKKELSKKNGHTINKEFFT